MSFLIDSLSCLIQLSTIIFVMSLTDRKLKKATQRILTFVTSRTFVSTQFEELSNVMLHFHFGFISLRAFDTSFMTVEKVRRRDL